MDRLHDSRPTGPSRSALALLVPAALVAACIVVPRTAEVYDPACRAFSKQVVLDVAVLGQIGHCHNDGCLALLVSAGIITAASAVVAGSVAVVGNIAYWLERGGQCPDPLPPSRPAN